MHRPFCYHDHLQQRATLATKRLRHLCTKTVFRRQGARPPGATHRVRRPHEKKEAAKKSLVRKKTLLRSGRLYGKTVRRLRLRCAGIKARLHTSKGSRWPPRTAALHS